MTVEYLSAEHYQPKKDLSYVDVFDLYDIYDALAFKANLVSVGPKGIGKSLSIQSWCAKNDVPVITFDCSEDVRRNHLLGTFVLKGGDTPFVLGPLTTGFQIANDVGKCVVVLEEVNALTPQMQKVLNSVADFRKRIEVPEAGQVFELKDGSQLWLCGTMNTSLYGGVYSLNEDLKSRLRMMPLSYPSEDQERAIISKTMKVEERLVDQVLTLAKETRQTATEYALSTRDVVQIIEDMLVCGPQKALWLASGKFEESDRQFFTERVRSIFAIHLDGE